VIASKDIQGFHESIDISSLTKPGLRIIVSPQKSFIAGVTVPLILTELVTLFSFLLSGFPV
jgi:hypothetical protein